MKNLIPQSVIETIYNHLTKSEEIWAGSMVMLLANYPLIDCKEFVMCLVKLNMFPNFCQKVADNFGYDTVDEFIVDAITLDNTAIEIMELAALGQLADFKTRAGYIGDTVPVVQEMCYQENQFGETVFCQSFWDKAIQCQAGNITQSVEEHGALGMKILVNWEQLVGMICPSAIVA